MTYFAPTDSQGGINNNSLHPILCLPPQPATLSLASPLATRS
jgi:hypothetical protein